MKRISPNHPASLKATKQSLAEGFSASGRGTLEPDLDRDDFEPRLPTRTLKDRGGILGHLKRASGARARAGGRPTARAHKGIRGKCHGPRSYSQQVVVKARVVSGSGVSATERMRKHRTYLTRSGTGLTGSKPEFFDSKGYCTPEQLHVQGLSWQNDPHHFRFIISPEQGARLDLEDYVRSVMKEVGSDLKTNLEWYGVCHHNTDNAHAHVVLGGRDEGGNPLIISRDYLSHGMRHVAEREASLRLGERRQEEMERGLAGLAVSERYTFLDRELLREQSRSVEGVVRVVPLGPSARETAHTARINKLRRLAFLESKGLAREERAGVWRVERDMEGVLRELGYRRKVEGIVAPLLVGRDEAKQDLLIHKEGEAFKPGEIMGTVLAKDLIDELHEKRFLLVSGDDGRNHFIPLGSLSEPSGFECRPGQVVRVSAQKPSEVRAEEVILRHLGKKGGALHLTKFSAHVRSELERGTWSLPAGVQLEEYMGRFVSRLRSLERWGVVISGGEGVWKIPSEVVERAQRVEALVNKKLKVSVKVEAHQSLTQEATRTGASWLDRIVARNERRALAASGAFGLAVRRAIQAREEALAQRGISFTKDTYAALLRQEERELLVRLREQHGGSPRALKEGEEVAGVVLGYELLGDGYRMVVSTEDGFVTRPLAHREERMAPKSEVTVARVRLGVEGKSLVRVRLKKEVHGANQGRSVKG